MFNTWDEELSPEKFFTIVIMSYTRPVYLKQLLQSIHECADMPVEIIVHDDASGRELEVEIFNECRHLSSTMIFGSPLQVNMGLAASCNRAIALANSKYVMVMNDDCKMLGPGLRDIIKVLEVPYIGSFGPWQCSTNVVPGQVFEGTQLAVTSNEADFCLGALANGAGMFAFRKALWEELGGFPQVYTNAGDTGFMIRLLKHGYFNAGNFVNRAEFLTNVDQMDGYKDPTAGKSSLDSSYPHVFKGPDLRKVSEHRRVRVYNYSHENYYSEAGDVNHTWFDQHFQEARKGVDHGYNWEVFKRFGQIKWRDQVERDLAAWRAKA